jgi:putative endonuclease
MQFSVYILKSLKTGKFYVGQTNNLERRLWEHNLPKSSYDKQHSPFILLYSCKFDNRKQAMKVERFYKTGDGRKKIKHLVDNAVLESVRR